jgi:hypothetical protein
MITEENTIRIFATFNDERTHRYTLKRVWREDANDSKTATIIMSNASTADITKGDLTSMLIQNNLSALNYSAVTICNLFSFMCQKLDLSGDINDLTNDENLQQILQSVQETDITIIGIGTLAKMYKKASVYQNHLFEALRPYQSKIHTISAPDGTEGLHPLSAKLREVGSWELVKFKLPDPTPAKTDEIPPTDTDIITLAKGKKLTKNERK